MKKKPLIIILILAFFLRIAFIFNPYFGLNSYEKELLVGNLASITCVFGADCGLPFYSGLISVLRPVFDINGGLTVIFAARVFSAALGVAWIYLSYFLVEKKLDRKQSLVFLLICATAPQFILMSRFYTPVSLAFPLFVISFYFLQIWFKNKRNVDLFSWAILLILSCFSSLHFGLIAIFILFVYFLISKNKSKKGPFLLLTLVSAAWFIFSWRHNLLVFNKIAPIFSDPGVINAINASRGVQQEVSGPLIAKLLFNKSYYLVYLFSLFVKQFSLNNVFSLIEPSGSSLIFDGRPMLVLFAPFFVYGFFLSFKKTKLKPWKTFVFLLFSAVPTAVFSLNFYQDMFVIPLALIVFYSVLGVTKSVKTKLRTIIFTFLLLINMVVSYYYIANGFFRSERLENKHYYQEMIRK